MISVKFYLSIIKDVEFVEDKIMSRISILMVSFIKSYSSYFGFKGLFLTTQFVRRGV
jgi:hypothetical protein